MLKILFISANPRDTASPLSIESERIEIEKKIAQFKGKYEFKDWDGIRAEDLLPIILEFKPNILHFTGHASKEGVPVFLNNDDEGRLVPVGPFVRALSLFKDNIECVVLNACFTEALAKNIAQHIKCVIGSFEKVDDKKEGLVFSPLFYHSMLSLDRYSVGRAFKFAEAQVALISGRDNVFAICPREDVDPDDIYLLPLDTKSLPPKVLHKISSFLVCYNDIRDDSAFLNIWEDERCGSLRSLLYLIQDNAKDYQLSSKDVKFIDDTILFLKANIGRPGVDPQSINEKFQACRDFFKRWKTDYEKDLVESTRYNYWSSSDDKVFTIVHGFYEVIDSMIDLKLSANLFVQNYKNKRFLRSLVTQNRQMCSSLQDKLKTLREDLAYQKDNGRTIWNPHTWNEIILIQDNLVNQISKLTEYFTDVDQVGANLAVMQIMETTRNEIKRLWTRAIKNILYTGGLDTVA